MYKCMYEIERNLEFDLQKKKEETRVTIRRSERDEERRHLLLCDWEECEKAYLTRAGLKTHQQVKYRMVVRKFD